MRILFCDDDPEIIALLMKYVKEYFTINKMSQPEYAYYLSGDDLLQQENKADIVFLDVEMPGRSGIHVGAQLMERNPRTKVFIVTSYPDYLDEAMRFRVFRYLSKPINKNRLFLNLKDALYQWGIETVKIPIETLDTVKVLDADEIICCEGMLRKTKIYTVDGEYVTLKGIESWKQLLNMPCFFQTYRSFIVNMKYVVAFDKSIVKLKHGNTVLEPYLARRKYTEFKNEFLRYMESVK